VDSGDEAPEGGRDRPDRSGDRGTPPPRPRGARARDGTALVIRPLRPSDRRELAVGYDQLSDESRRRRFFSPPNRLSEPLLDYLTELDFDRHVALVAQVGDGPGQEGIGVARWIRDRDDPSRAEAAVTVADRWQGRGIGTQLLLALVEEAAERGITTFVADVLWSNRTLLDTLRELGARVEPSEPGVARVEFDLPPPGADLGGTAMHRMLVASAEAAAS
jgi:GNAT superfamily N-acetyltransferase